MTSDRPDTVVSSEDGLHLSRDIIAELGSHRLATLILQEISINTAFRAKLLMLLRDIGSDKHVNLFKVIHEDTDEPHFVGDSSAMRHVFSQIRKYAITDLPVLVTGESGTGKELAALAIHERSSFSQGPFVAVNCSGLPASLITSELFGYEKGAFTGANQRKIGRIEAADGGTIFLDEIGDLPLELQGHLLRFLQDKTIDRVGAQRPIQVNARIIAATNRDLIGAVEEGTFRLDLYYRLNVLPIHLPPLRERENDVEILTRYFIKKFQKEFRSAVQGIEADALNQLIKYDWPGNVRELISTIRRAIVVARGTTITSQDLTLAPVGSRELKQINDEIVSQMRGSLPPSGKPDGRNTGLSAVRTRVERSLLYDALIRNRHNVTRTAKELGVSRVTLYRLMDKHDLRPRNEF